MGNAAQRIRDWKLLKRAKASPATHLTRVPYLDTPLSRVVADAGWVAGKIETSRRREVLLWSHHREVAALPAKAQDLRLGSAEKEGWTVRDLRRAVRRSVSSIVDTSCANRATSWYAALTLASHLGSPME